MDMVAPNSSERTGGVGNLIRDFPNEPLATATGGFAASIWASFGGVNTDFVIVVFF